MALAIELFGVPRLRAGTSLVRVEAATAGEAVRALARACPGLEKSMFQGGFLHPAYRLSLNGERFLDGPDEAIADGETLLLISADAGG